MCFILLNISTFAADNNISKETANIADYVLGENGLKILPNNHHGQTLTRAEMIDILIDFTNVADVKCAQYLFSLSEGSTNKRIIKYEDYPVSQDKENCIRRLIASGILPGDSLIYPDKLCTWNEAAMWIVRVVDRVNISKSYG